IGANAIGAAVQLAARHGDRRRAFALLHDRVADPLGAVGAQDHPGLGHAVVLVGDQQVALGVLIAAAGVGDAIGAQERIPLISGAAVLGGLKRGAAQRMALDAAGLPELVLVPLPAPPALL